MAPLESVPKRRISFEYPDDMSPVWTPTRPEFSCAANSISLMMPAIEPYFVRSIRVALPELPDPLRARTEAYLFQEAQHHHQHVRFNRLVLSHYPGLARLERLIARSYRRLESGRSSQFNIGFTAGSETMAYSAARWAADNRLELFDNSHDVASTLFLWHLAEEVEHKSVAHDVYQALYGDRPRSRLRYAAATSVALTMMIIFVVAGTAVMVTAERRLHRPITWLRLGRWSLGFAFELLSNLVLSLIPGHHPTDFTDPLWYELWLREFDGETGTFPVWNDVDPVIELERSPAPPI